MGALALLWFGTAYFMGVRRPVWLFLSPMMVVLLTFPVLNYIIPSQLARIAVGSVLAAIGCYDGLRSALVGVEINAFTPLVRRRSIRARIRRHGGSTQNGVVDRPANTGGAVKSS